MSRAACSFEHLGVECLSKFARSGWLDLRPTHCASVAVCLFRELFRELRRATATGHPWRTVPGHAPARVGSGARHTKAAASVAATLVENA